MKGATVLSKKYVLKFHNPYPGRRIAEEMSRVLNNLGDRLNYKGKIIGHIKSIVTSGEHYLHISVTNLPDINIKADPGWDKKEYGEIELTINIIIFGFSKEQIENFLIDSMRETLFVHPGF